jgi:hypothetical protein
MWYSAKPTLSGTFLFDRTKTSWGSNPQEALSKMHQTPNTTISNNPVLHTILLSTPAFHCFSAVGLILNFTLITIADYCILLSQKKRTKKQEVRPDLPASEIFLSHVLLAAPQSFTKAGLFPFVFSGR